MRGSVGPHAETMSIHGMVQFPEDTDAIRVVVVEHDQGRRAVLEGKLSDYGFSVRSFADDASFLDSPDAAFDADVLLLNWTAPSMSGIDMLLQMRRRGVNLPVVLMTGSNTTDQAVNGGTVDFIDKARELETLVRLLRRIIRPVKLASSPELDGDVVCGKLVLKPNSSRTFWNNTDIGLTLGEYNVVHLLASNIGRHVTYRAIYDRLRYEGFIAGSGEHGYRANVRAVIKRIRDKFRAYDPTFAEIENYTGFGYCWRKTLGRGLLE